MANQIPSLGLANTFGDWIVTTNSVLKETNYLGANNYTKDSGTLIIQSSGTGLQVANDALVQGSFSVSGTGSSATIQNNLTVTQGQIRASNPATMGLRVDGSTNVNGVVAFGSTITVLGNARVLGVNANSYITSPEVITNQLNAGAANVINGKIGRAHV